MKKHTDDFTGSEFKSNKHVDDFTHSDEEEEKRVDTAQVGKTVKKIKDYFKRQEQKRIEDLIPGNIHKDVIVLARRTRLEMTQAMYNRGEIDVKEAQKRLNGRLTQDDPNTYFDDSGMLQKKESDR